jgi:hypothetical protein
MLLHQLACCAFPEDPIVLHVSRHDSAGCVIPRHSESVELTNLAKDWANNGQRVNNLTLLTGYSLTEFNWQDWTFF